MKMTTAQLEAVYSTAKNLLVVAGPGSGKTATTVQRIRRLLSEGADPKAMVALTFTNAAARELESRIDQVFTGASLGYVGTLHGFALKMLKQWGQTIGYGDRLTIISEDAIADLVASRAKSLGCKTPVKKLLELKAKIAIGRDVDRRETLDELVLKSYREELREGGMVDFDTILSEFFRMIVGWNKSGLGTLGYTHLFVDEVQDSAVIDWDIYWTLPIANRFFVGDQDQSIYAFRGGRPDMMELRDEGAIVILEDNFRSHSEICWGAQRLIENNRERIRKQTVSAKGVGGDIGYWKPAVNPGEEIGQIASSIRVNVEGDAAETTLNPKIEDYEQVAVLARTNAICHEIREGLKAIGIPVVDQKPVDVPPDWNRARLLIELLVNPYNDLLAWLYCIASNVAMGMKPERARAAAHVVQNRARSEEVPLSRLLECEVRAVPLSAVGAVLASHKITAESRMRVATVMKTLRADAEIIDLALALVQDQGEVPSPDRGVTVTTFHGAKGREWDTVILAGMEDEIMPGRREHEVEEARRLMYVGVTRARRRLYCTWSKSRKTSWGAMESHTQSRFIREMQA